MFCPAASSGPRPQNSVGRSQPRTDMLATSLLVGNPSGKVRSVPQHPLLAMESMAGVFATCRGVLPPRDLIGSSAMPSPKNIIVLFLMILALF